MSKTPAKRPAPVKTAAKKIATPAKKVAVKAASKPAVKPAAKTAKKATAKPIAKVAVKKPAAKPAIKMTPKTAGQAKAASPKPVPSPRTAPPVPVPAKTAPVTKPVVPAPPPPAPKPAKTAQPRLSAAARASAAASTPAPIPPPTSRFADRFAPPRPPTRQMNSLLVDIERTERKSDPRLANAWKTKTGRDLTEDEVLAMPDSEYMNEKQLEFFRLKLQTLKDDLLSNAGETTEHLREDTSIVPDPADRATIEEEHALELRTRDRERKLLKKISQSLVRIDTGDYGFCDETGEPIGLGRLIARPTATLSLEAQQRRELKQKMFGD